MATRSVSLALLGLVGLFPACATPTKVADSASDPQLATDVRAIVAELGPGARAAVWLGPAGGAPTLAWNVEVPMPVASAIKAAYLVELFAARADALDAPLPGTAELLADTKHAAVAHFSAAQRATAAKALGTASARRIGEAMVRGNGVDNATYNLAANIVTSFCGGPAWLEQKLHARVPEWRGLRVRRYMLANRTEHGDNEATAHALAAVHGGLARRDVPGLSRATIDACRAVLAQRADAQGRESFAKGGSLDSDPLTRVDAGWREDPSGPVVYVVMLAHAGVPAGDRAAAGQRLGDATRRIRERLFAARQPDPRTR
jgi:hypothetical protein